MKRETWTSRDGPVLTAIVDLADEGRVHVSPHDVAERTGFDLRTVELALAALASESPPFFQFTDCTGFGDDIRTIDNIRDVSGHARRTVGTWPTPEVLADRLVAGLQQAADNAEDEEEAGRLRRAGQAVSGLGRDVLVNVLGSALGGG
ncbi:hypothetical protein [Thermomonospora umbrina]|uniref:Uncharacterized protein n=1 Tax=Thermomonospora umbrina TaxID=111806 RepID=A0A3D9SWN5_9ACTN|nr:hypothetical protein [Thermomonospora umbrina]REF00363.1 hypothetical protein DFJ69_5895 [Thermomonospora umbrina]